MPRKHASEKPKDLKRSIRFLLKSLRPYAWRFALPIFCAVVANVLSAFIPILLGNITNLAVSDLQATGHVNLTPIKLSVLRSLAIVVLIAALAYLESYTIGKLVILYTRQLRSDLVDKISRLPMAYFNHHKFGDTLSVVVNDTDAIASTLAEEAVQILANLTTVIMSIVFMLRISPSLTLIMFIVLPVSFFSISLIAKKTQTYFMAGRTLLGQLNSCLEEDYSGQQIIKNNSHFPASFADFSKVNDELYENTWRAQFLGRLAYPFIHFFTNLGYVVVCIFGGNMVLRSVLSVGDIQAFLQYVSRFNSPLINLSEIMSSIQGTLAAAERISLFLEQAEESPNPEPGKQIAKVRGAIEFNDVCFSYDKKTPVIKHFSAKIKPGQQVAIVGPTGAGKTTLVNLLMRFYDPDSGYITIDGVPISEMRREDVRQLFAMVLQDTWLFSGSVKDNLAYGKPKATLAEIRRATKAAGIDHLISAMPKGYSTEISEDSDNVSAGQKQLLTIARAMIKNPPMMILDEATSNVDTRAEQLIQEAFNKLTQNRTSFVIAHRLSTIRNADLILVLKDGNICEQGTHDELLKQGGFYAELYNSQFAEQ